jgi:putative ABC transport system permease protein
MKIKLKNFLTVKTYFVAGLKKARALLAGSRRLAGLLRLDEELLRIAFGGLLAHRLRSFLTMLGIIFGVAAVIAMLAIGEGARRKTLSQIQSLGLQNIIIKQQLTTDAGDEEEQPPGLSFGDIEALREIIVEAESLTPVIERELQAYNGSRQLDVKLLGTTPEYFRISSLRPEQGTLYSERDNHDHQRVCVLGNAVAKALFPVENPLGKLVRVGEIWMRVIGALAYHPVSVAGTEEVDLNRNVYAPFNSVNLRFDRGKGFELEQIIIRVKEGRSIPAIAKAIDNILYRRHNFARSYTLLIPEQLLRQSESTQRIFNIVMGAIAGISLLVGGIGIMNIMLASVLERTREIGVRRAVGARQKDIMNQFLLEAVTISLTGGVIGILLGYLLTFGVTLFSEWETAISLWSALLAFGVSSGVGVAFGYYPAKQAAGLNPIDALRYE